MNLPSVLRPRPARTVARTGLGTLALLAAAVLAAYAVSERVAPVYADVATRSRALDRVAPEVEAAVFGNSHAYALRFDVLGRNGFYFNWGSGDLFESRRLLQYAVPKLPNLEEVYLVVSPYQGDHGMDYHQTTRRSVYAQTGSLRPISGDWRLALTTPFTRVVRPDHWYRVLRPTPARRPLADGSFPFRGVLEQPPDTIDASARVQSERHASGMAQLAEQDPSLCRNLSAALRGFVRDAGDLRVVLVTPPYYESYDTTGASCDVVGMARSAVAGRANAVYVDLRDSPISARPALFYDGSHMNPKGAALFTRALRERMERRERPDGPSR